MTIRWRRIPTVLSPVTLLAIAFFAYAYSLPSIRCVIVNESQQTTVKASGKRCTALSPGEEAVVLTTDGAYIGGDNR